MNDECEHEQDTKMNMGIVLENFPFIYFCMFMEMAINLNMNMDMYKVLEQVHFRLRLHAQVHDIHEH
jgi:hypothetical protein